MSRVTETVAPMSKRGTQHDSRSKTMNSICRNREKTVSIDSRKEIIKLSKAQMPHIHFLESFIHFLQVIGFFIVIWEALAEWLWHSLAMQRAGVQFSHQPT